MLTVSPFYHFFISAFLVVPVRTGLHVPVGVRTGPYVVVAVLPLLIFEYPKFNAKNPDIPLTKYPENSCLIFCTAI